MQLVSLFLKLFLSDLNIQVGALIGIQVDPNKLEEVGNAVSNHEYTTWVSRTTGGYDIFTWVTVPDSKELTNFLTYYLGNLDGVNKTETFINLEVLKRGL